MEGSSMERMAPGTGYEGGRVFMEDLLVLGTERPTLGASKTRHCPTSGCKAATRTVTRFYVDDPPEYIVCETGFADDKSPSISCQEWVPLFHEGKCVWYKAIAEVVYCAWHYTCSVDTNLISHSTASDFRKPSTKWVTFDGMESYEKELEDGWQAEREGRLIFVLQRAVMEAKENTERIDRYLAKYKQKILTAIMEPVLRPTWRSQDLVCLSSEGEEGEEGEE